MENTHYHHQLIAMNMAQSVCVTDLDTHSVEKLIRIEYHIEKAIQHTI